jgi:pimeloyl-ACP methyl ester carboxylesterase
VAQLLPIVYVRGFAGGTSGINAATDDPFYGFNAGSTHIRVGREGIPQYYQFESPLLRLMMDHGYALRVSGDQQRLLDDAPPDSIPAATLWIYRFYDRSADTFGTRPTEFRIEDAAQGLADFIHEVLLKTKDADQVYLVAHSMGGLVCRSAIQRFLCAPDCAPALGEGAAVTGAVPDPDDQRRAPASGKMQRTFPVSKVVTYATPHGGIDIELGGPIGDWVIDTFGPNGSDIFRERRMREYLSPPGREDWSPVEGDWDPREPYFSALPAERFLSLVGTNPGDYDVAAGWSARAVGVKSDGLVQIRNAYVKGSNRSYIHRSHSGRYGIVNSEEGYQNLRRFLFGNLKVSLSFSNLSLDTSEDTVWQADVSLAVRGLPVLMHEQSAAHHCPVVLTDEARKVDTPDAPIPLVNTFLLPVEPGQPRRYALDLRVFALREKGGLFSWHTHLEQIADWQDTLLVDVVTDENGLIQSASWQWNSTLAGSIAKTTDLVNQLTWRRTSDYTAEAPRWTCSIEFPTVAGAILGDEAQIVMGAAYWK